jgi:hypothetical protein
VIDACDVNDRFWVFYSAATTVGFTLTVEDVVAQGVKTYVNPDRTAALTASDTRAFDTCP